MSLSIPVVFDVCVTDPITVDPVAYKYWLHGKTAQECARHRIAKSSETNTQVWCAGDPDRYGRLVLRETLEQFCTFGHLQPVLQNPALAAEGGVPLTPAVLHDLVERYFGLEPLLIREVAGKKLTSSLRRDLDEVSERTRIPLTSCQRQFDNLRRVSKSLGDGTAQGSTMDHIQRHFLLSHELASLYRNIIFLCENRIDFNKRRLQQWNCQELMECAEAVVNQWSSPWSSEVDTFFYDEGKELKSILLSKDVLEEFRISVMQLLSSPPQIDNVALHALPSAKVQAMGKLIPQLIRSVFSIHQGLNQQKEVRDLFVDIGDKLLDPLRKIDFDRDNIKSMMTAFELALSQSALIDQKAKQRFEQTWHRVLTVLTVVLDHL